MAVVGRESTPRVCARRYAAGEDATFSVPVSVNVQDFFARTVTVRVCVYACVRVCVCVRA